VAKKGMRRPDPRAPHGEHDERMHIPRNEVPPVPELQGKAKRSDEKANPILEK
jgi:hypothetical protein